MKIELSISDVAKDTVDQLAKQGFIMDSSLDIEQIKLPLDITVLDDEALMELFSRLTIYLDFVSTQVSLAQIDEKDAEKATDMALSRTMANLSSAQPKTPATVLKAAALADPVVEDLSYKHSVKYNYRKLIETMATNTERDINLVSRELTRRTASGAVLRTRKFIT